MKSKTKITKQIDRKNNFGLVETVRIAKKNEAWIKVADLLSRPRRKRICVNLEDLNEITKSGEGILVPGKILSEGSIDKKIKVVAFNFSEKAKAKLIKEGCEVKSILEEIKSNPEAKGLKIIK